MELAVLKAIVDAGQGGLIDEEIPEKTHLRESTCRARRVELHQKGEIRDSGRTRPTSSGRQATIWIARSARPGPAEVSAPPREAARAPVGREDQTAEAAESAEAAQPPIPSASSAASAVSSPAIAAVPATRHAPPATSNPRPCTWCGRSTWWRSVHGVIVCAHCYPPAAPELVAEWIGESRPQ